VATPSMLLLIAEPKSPPTPDSNRFRRRLLTRDRSLRNRISQTTIGTLLSCDDEKSPIKKPLPARTPYDSSSHNHNLYN
jgi:hypothetical protein